jgi:predicted transcriptional regulator
MDQTKLTELFIVKNLSQRAVAKELGCSQATVRHFIKKYGLIKSKSIKSGSSKRDSKICSKCGEKKLISEFYIRKSRKDEITSWCKECNGRGVVERMRSTKSELVISKGGCCQLCSFSEYFGALEFHHIDPKTKDDGVSKLIRGKITQKIIDEINKCVLVCSNCHKMIHAGIRECPKPADSTYRL